MSPEKQRIAIAEACGWKNFNSASHKGAMQYGQPPNAPHNSWELPDYLNDLNAMHEAEKALTSEQHIDYMEWLGMCSDDYGRKVWAYVHCSASERARAFLRTLGLWQETPTQPQ